LRPAPAGRPLARPSIPPGRASSRARSAARCAWPAAGSSGSHRRVRVRAQRRVTRPNRLRWIETIR